MAQDLQRWHVGSEVHHPGATFMADFGVFAEFLMATWLVVLQLY